MTQRLNAGEVLAWRFDMLLGSARHSRASNTNASTKNKPCVDFRVSVNGKECTLTGHGIEDMDILVPQVSNSGIIRALRDDTEVVLTWKPSSSDNVASAMSNRSMNLLTKKRNGTEQMKQLNFSVAKVTRRAFRRVIRRVRQNYLAQRPFVGCSHVSMESMFQTTRMKDEDENDEMSHHVAVGAYRFRKSYLDERRQIGSAEDQPSSETPSSPSSFMGGRNDESVVTTAMTLNSYIHPVSIVRSVLGRSRGRHRWHFKVIDVGVGGVSVGISGALVSLNRPLGTDKRSYAFHSSGIKRHNGVTNRFGSVFENGAHIVVHLDLEASLGGELSFTVNGKDMHRAFVNIDRDGPKYYPAIELSSGAEVYVKGDVFENHRTFLPPPPSLVLRFSEYRHKHKNAQVR